MTDYSKLKLRASSSPHIHSEESTKTLMLDVIIAMLPALVMGIYTFGFRALATTCVSVIGCVVFEFLYRKLMKKSQSVGDLSAVVTGMLIALISPVTVPYGVLLVGDFFAIVVVKQLYGGMGKNFLNPALAARAFMGGWASAMTTFVAPMTRPAIVGAADVVTAATPMSYLKEGNLAGLQEVYDLGDMFLGAIGGSMGEVCSAALLVGGIYLIGRKVINWHIPVAYIGTVALLTFLFPGANDPLQFMLYHVLGGGLFLGAFFMATDYVTSPVSKSGQLIFGVGCGLITVFIRFFGAYPEGVCYSILVMNLLVWLIDRSIKPRRFGVVKAKKEGAGK